MSSSCAALTGSACGIKEPTGEFVASKEPGGYRILVNRRYAYWPNAPRDSSISSVGGFLAREAGRTLLLWNGLTARSVSGEWTGETGLEAFRKLVDAAGLRLIADDNFWLVLPLADGPRHLELSVFALQLDTEHFQPGIGQNDELERALLRALPPHEIGFDGRVSIGVTYVELSAERSDIFLVLPTWTTSMVAREGRWIGAYKVRAVRKGGRYDIECLWPRAGGSTSISGPLVAVAEDFDGDGYRDFVFHTDDPEDGPDVILSGKDGHELAAFIGETLAVEKSLSGPKRFVAGKSWEELGPPRLFEYDAQAKRFRARDVDETAVKRIARERSQSAYRSGLERDVEDARSAVGGKAPKRPSSGVDRLEEYESGRLLVKKGVASQNVRLYYMPGARRDHKTPFEEVVLRPSNWDRMLTRSRTDAGAAGRILYRFFASTEPQKKGD